LQRQRDQIEINIAPPAYAAGFTSSSAHRPETGKSLKKSKMSPNKQEYTITVYTENQIGLINRIAILFSRRKINIESLNTSPSEVEGIHRFTIVINETEEVVRKLCRQIEKQVDILKAYYNTNDEIIWQEMALYKVSTDEIAEKVKVERLLREYGARAVVIRKDYTVFETTGQREETDRLVEVLEPFGLIEFVRSARVAIIKASHGFHEKLREFELTEPGNEVVENEYLDKQDEVFTM
jgi:acetolactate synthase-1/3 small subunit